ncbi:hypothetical protein BJ138DRAFT_1113255 [Hygrophoropsis aurantiaca]|uniref:Uncharacterized protein n=1 Tax=Hygrophoropsis aurantiaca TaxID=72124 RepID=A0ACB8AE17_9AGAM|nr:hypothetical protein BJ138DRAFT_1113255 [Hygrophoropsis aurantiaca]
MSAPGLLSLVSQVLGEDALEPEASVALQGILRAISKNQGVPGGHEIVVDSWRVLGNTPGADKAFINELSQQDPSAYADLRHLMLRWGTLANILRLLSAALSAFRATYAEHLMLEVTPPIIIQGQVEGPGAVLFKVEDYYCKQACLAPSSQMYLEACLASLSSAAHASPSERVHSLEAELALVDFEQLMAHIENICISYKSAIAWLNAHAIKHPLEDAAGNPVPGADGSPVMVDHVVGDEIAEAAETMLVDGHGEPLFLLSFPSNVRPFYMKRVPKAEGDTGPVWTESCDLLLPGVGEVVGGSMRITDINELLAAYESYGVDAAMYYWYTDQRTYGTCEHGVYALGVEASSFYGISFYGLVGKPVYCPTLLIISQTM